MTDFLCRFATDKVKFLCGVTNTCTLTVRVHGLIDRQTHGTRVMSRILELAHSLLVSWCVPDIDCRSDHSYPS